MTLLELSGASDPKQRQGHPVPELVGQSFARHLTDSAATETSRTLYWQQENHSAVRDGDWKLVTFNDRRDDGWELDRLRGGPRGGDRGETHNLAHEQPQRVAERKAKWKAWATQVNALPFPESRTR